MTQLKTYSSDLIWIKPAVSESKSKGMTPLKKEGRTVRRPIILEAASMRAALPNREGRTKEVKGN